MSADELERRWAIFHDQVERDGFNEWLMESQRRAEAVGKARCAERGWHTISSETTSCPDCGTPYEDFPPARERTSADSAAANVLIELLQQQFGWLPLSVRYKAAWAAIDSVRDWEQDRVVERS